MAPVQRLNGTRDLTPEQWRRLAHAQQLLQLFLDRRGYEVVSTPVLESTDLFLRKSGGELAARMYSFTDPSGRRVSLRPEFTSSVVRAYTEGSLRTQLPLRLQYCGTIFRYEVEEAGPREFWQFGAELLGAEGVAADAEALAFAVQGLTALGIKGHRLRIGHMGVVTAMLEALRLSGRGRVLLLQGLATLRSGPEGAEQLRSRARDLGLLQGWNGHGLTGLVQRLEAKDAEEMVQGFLADTVSGATGQRTPDEVFLRYLRKLREAEDPVRMERALELASALVGISGAPNRILPRLRALVRAYDIPETALAPMEQLLEELSTYDLGGVPITVDLGMGRGIAYYTGTVFDLEHPRIKGGPSLGGGGRYDGLVRALGGTEDVPALGFAYALDRVAELLPAEFGGGGGPATRVLVVAAGSTMAQAVATAERLRAQGIPAELDIVSRTEADAFRYARRRGVTTVMRIAGDGTTTEQEL